MCLGDCIKKHVFKMTTFLFMILFVIMIILYVKEKNVSHMDFGSWSVCFCPFELVQIE